MQSGELFDLEAIEAVLAEDLGDGDLTAEIVPPAMQASATVVTREPAVLCGRDWFDGVFRLLDEACEIAWNFADGDFVSADAELCTVRGRARALLSGERTALNWLQTLSATATLARAFAEAVRSTGTRILDTRKTLPGLRKAQKYAVRCGGCTNHRLGLYDGILIKENHIIAAGSIRNAVLSARDRHPGLSVEVEVESLTELDEALDVGVERVLLDNFSLDVLRKAVQINKGRALLEASGNVGIANVREVAETGVDFISVGALTKDVKAIDLSMNIEVVR
ncbi:MAG: carboxylating nicotinate-nucleotide diphosphorylase [Methylococcaceae bacterium]|nr:carboxylating nicotinate-nucleotide diphosphorylase [Methylococcaceae bacterium]MCI0666647.1 carboxylating nicotinate-nucleotide diphosphorylase [Methylococcaceae bacterium]MCI0733569.1 carboxylating nicotinate-nucleotide diphosphorylase [Methylococcaceae bacterium]